MIEETFILMDYPSPWQLSAHAQVYFEHGYFVNQRHKKIEKFSRRNNQEAAEKLLRNFREVRNNQETIEKLCGNYREVRNFREIIEKH